MFLLLPLCLHVLVLFLLQDGCLVVMWVTNRERHIRFVHEELLPHWGLDHIATWLWLKVTNSGELVTPLVRFPIVSALLCLSVKHHDTF